MWWHSYLVPTIVSFFSPACDVEPFCLLCSPTFYSSSVAPFFLIFHFLQCWPHNLNILFLYSSFHCCISASWEHAPPTHAHTSISPRMLFRFLSLLPFYYIHYIWIARIHIYVHKCINLQLVNAGSGTINIYIFLSTCVSRLANKLCQVCSTPAWLGSRWTKGQRSEQSSWFTRAAGASGLACPPSKGWRNKGTEVIKTDKRPLWGRCLNAFYPR